MCIIAEFVAFLTAPVHDIRVEPLLNEYAVGDVINCSANGLPEPSVTWQWVSGPESAEAASGPALVVTEEMKDERNVWKCVASNNQGTEEHTITFNVSRKLKTVSFLHGAAK